MRSFHLLLAALLGVTAGADDKPGASSQAAPANAVVQKVPGSRQSPQRSADEQRALQSQHQAQAAPSQNTITQMVDAARAAQSGTLDAARAAQSGTLDAARAAQSGTLEAATTAAKRMMTAQGPNVVQQQVDQARAAQKPANPEPGDLGGLTGREQRALAAAKNCMRGRHFKPPLSGARGRSQIVYDKVEPVPGWDNRYCVTGHYLVRYGNTDQGPTSTSNYGFTVTVQLDTDGNVQTTDIQAD